MSDQKQRSRNFVGKALIVQEHSSISSLAKATGNARSRNAAERLPRVCFTARTSFADKDFQADRQDREGGQHFVC